MTDGELKRAIRERAYLEGDFVLRSGRRSRFYLDKYRLETQPDLLEAIGGRLARTVAEVDPQATLLAGPELGAVALAAAASLASRLPFLIVRSRQKDHGTARRLEGVFLPGQRACLIEDVVTSGGAAVEAVAALRDAGLVCQVAVCVVDRQEGGAEALADQGVRLHALFTASDLMAA
ncbi:MAG: orotate phosphoribosyltransferase [Thermoleophilia bacterium]